MVKSADKKPEKYVGPDGKPKIRMVPVDKDVIKTEAANASKEAQRHMQGMKDARADMKVAKSADAMTKAMNKLQHHTKAHKKAMAAMGEAKDGDGVNIVKDRPFKGKPMKKEPDSGKGITFANMKKSKVAKDADANPNRAKAMGEAKEVDEISLKDLSNTIAKSTGNKNLKKALKTDKLKADLAKMKMATEAYETEPPSPDEKSMAIRQAKFIQYVGEELMEHMEQENDFPEWMQNKLSEFHQKAKDMHAVLAGEYEDEEEMDEETQLDEYGGPPISRAKYLKQKPMKERELTPAEMKKREKYAQDLPDDEFKKRYGDRWKSVKIATATKMAKGEK